MPEKESPVPNNNNQPDKLVNSPAKPESSDNLKSNTLSQKLAEQKKKMFETMKRLRTLEKLHTTQVNIKTFSPEQKELYNLMFSLGNMLHIINQELNKNPGNRDQQRLSKNVSELKEKSLSYLQELEKISQMDDEAVLKNYWIVINFDEAHQEKWKKLWDTINAFFSIAAKDSAFQEMHQTISQYVQLEKNDLKNPINFNKRPFFMSPDKQKQNRISLPDALGFIEKGIVEKGLIQANINTVRRKSEETIDKNEFKKLLLLLKENITCINTLINMSEELGFIKDYIDEKTLPLDLKIFNYLKSWVTEKVTAFFNRKRRE